MKLPYDLAILLLGIYPKELKIGTQTDTCTPMFIAALITIVEWWKQSKYPSTDIWINEMEYIHTIEYYAVMKSNEMLTYYSMDESWKLYAK